MNSIADSNALVGGLIERLKKENFAIDFYRKRSGKRNYYELRFKTLLQELDVSRQQEEKLAIKLDFEMFWKARRSEALLLNRYGFLVNVVTSSIDSALVQKLTAYVKRRQTQPRDIYDVVWLIAHGAKFDSAFAKANFLSRDVIARALKKFEKEKNHLKSFETRLKPFLINESYTDKLSFFPQLARGLQDVV
jgi:hypothetical protein